MDLINKLLIKLTHRRVGQDGQGNEYFQHKKYPKKRTIIYASTDEPSTIPPMWHAWMHGITNIIIINKPYTWQTSRKPSATGTLLAHFPSGRRLRGAKRDIISSDYQAWEPRVEKYDQQ